MPRIINPFLDKTVQEPLTLKDIKENVRCTGCKREIEPKQIKLVKPPLSVITPFREVYYLKKDGYIRVVLNDTYVFQEGDKVMSCPHCEMVHFGGFDPADGPRLYQL